MKDQINRPIVRFLQISFLVIFTAVSALGNVLGMRVVRSANAAPLVDYAASNAWPDSTHNTITRDNKIYNLYRVVENGIELGIYAIDQTTGGRVQDPDLEISLIYEVATLNKWYDQPSEIILPVSNYQVVPNAEYTTTYQHTFTYSNPTPVDPCRAGTFTTDIANFIAYDDPLFDVPTWEQMVGYPEFYSLGSDSYVRGLNCSDVVSKTYGRVILKSILQEVNSPEMQQEYLERAANLLIETRKNDPGTFLSQIGLLTDIEVNMVEGYVEANSQYLIQPNTLQSIFTATEHQAYLKRGIGLNKFLGAGLSALSTALTYREHEINISTRALLIMVQREYLLADAEYRLSLLKNYINQNQNDFDPAIVEGIDLAIAGFNKIKDKDLEARVLALKDETIQLSSTKLAVEIGGLIVTLASLIPWLGIGAAVSTIALPVGIIVFVITTVMIPYYTEKIEYLGLLREMSVAYTFSKDLADSLPNPGESFLLSGSISNIKDLMTLINIAWYSRLLFYHAIGDYRPHVDPSDWHGLVPDISEFYWRFNKPDGTLTRIPVNTEGSAGFYVSYSKLKTTNNGFYLDTQERNDLAERQLLYNAEKNFIFGVGQLPFEGQNFTKGSVVPLKLQAESGGGIKFVEFFVYPAGGSLGTPHCTDTNGPDAQGYWTCPSSPGWDTFGEGTGAYYVQARATNALGIAETINPIRINVVQTSDSITVNTSLNPSSLTVDDTFSASGTVLVNGQGQAVQVKVEIVGTGIQKTVTSNSNGTYSISNITVPQIPGNYPVKVTGSTSTAAGYTIATLTVSARPSDGDWLAITDYAVSDHVEPGKNVRFRAFVHNKGQHAMTFRLIYELRNPSGTVVDSYTGPLTTLQPSQVYPGTSADVQYLSTTSTTGTYKATARLVDSFNAPISDRTPEDNSLTLGVLVSNTTDFNHYQVTSQYGDVGQSKTFTLVSTFTVDVLATSAQGDSTRLTIKKGSTVIANGLWYDEDRDYYLQGETIYLHIDNVSGLRAAWTLGEATASSHLTISPSNPLQVKAGSDGTLLIESAFRITSPDVDFYGKDAAYVNDNWSPSSTTLNSERTIWELELEIPANETIKTFEFFVDTSQYASPYARYLEKVIVQVLAPDDVGVSALYPASGTTYLAGDTVDINATIHNYATYLEAEVPVNLTITGPDSYTFYTGQTVTGLSGGADKPANFTWQTSGLSAGPYTVNVSTALANDPKTGNDLLSRTLILQQKPAMSVTANMDKTSYGQNTPILLSASVVDPSAVPVSGALVYATITGPSVNETRVMTYNASTQKYEIGLSYTNNGEYQYNVVASKDGYLPGQTASPGAFTIQNAPPDTWITSATVEQGGWLRSNSFTLNWAGSDPSTPSGSLQYSYKVDGGAWSTYSGAKAVTIENLAEGSHTVYVRSYDGVDADPTPAEWQFWVDTLSPVFDTAPVSSLNQVADGSTVKVTLDLNETVIPTITFGELDSGFTAGAITIQEVNSSAHIYELTYTITQNNWRPDGEYILPIIVQDMAGNTSSNYSILLRLENNNPTIISKSPNSGDTVNETVSIYITFSEPMNKPTVESAFSIQPSVNGTIGWNGNTLSFSPTAVLSCGTTHSVQVGSSAVDVVGKAITATTWAFSTQECGYPEMDVKGNNTSIMDGDSTPSETDHTNFGNANVAGGTVSRTFTIYNTGNANLLLNNSPGVVITGVNAADFTVSVQPSSPVAGPSGSTTFAVIFDPDAAGLRSAEVSIPSNDSDENPYNFSIQGTGMLTAPEMDVKGNNTSIVDGDNTPSTSDHTDFGSANVAGGTVSRTFTIYNSGNTDLNLTGSPKVAISGTHAADFNVSVQPTSPVAMTNGLTIFTVVFDPGASGLRVAMISIANNDSDENPYNFSIQGTGVITAPEMDVKGNSVSIADGDTTPSVTDHTDFGNINIVNGSLSRTFTIYNTGNAVLNLTSTPKVMIGGAHAADFNVTVQPTSPVAATTGSTIFTVVFDPSATGLRTATISIANNDPDENPYNFSIQGTGDDTQCETLLFSDDFSTAKGWTDQSGVTVIRDSINQWLNWDARRDTPLHYYYPINAQSGTIQMELRFKANSNSGNGMVWFGLAESLTDVLPNVAAADKPGFFFAPDSNRKIQVISLYSDRTSSFVDGSSSALTYGSYNVWRRAILTIDQLNWKIEVKDDTGTLLSQMSGVLPRQHTSYNYIMLMFNYGSGWENMTGNLDDLKVYGCPNTIFEDHFTDGNITSNPVWTPNNNAYAVIDEVLNSDGLHTDGSDRYSNSFVSHVSMPVNDYLEFSYRGMLKSQGAPQTGRGTQLVLGSDETDKNYQLSIQRGYTNGFPTDKYSLSLGFGTMDTITDLIVTDFQPNYDQFYEIKAIRVNGQWSLYVDGSIIGTAQDPGAFGQLEHIVLYTVGSVAVDDIRVTTVGNTAIDVYIGGQLKGSYGVESGQERREYYDVSGGPVVVESQNTTKKIVSAIRLQSYANNTLYSFVETMGVPSGLLSHKYYFPTYNNTWGPLNSQVRFGNLSSTPTTIRVTIGGKVEWEQSVPGLEERRLYFDVSGGPVIIESLDPTKKIVAAIRLQSYANNILYSFAETMGIPDEYVSDTYYFPTYNNTWGPLNSQLRFGNLGTEKTEIRVKIGDSLTETYIVEPQKEMRLYYDVSDGPVIVESLVDDPLKGTTKQEIVAAIRLQSYVGGKLYSFVETMGVPSGLLSHKYYFPTYNNTWAPLNSQVRFGNLSAEATRIRVTIGGAQVWEEDVPGLEERRLYFDVSGGPAIIESLDPAKKIVAAIRLQSMQSGTLYSFSETMGIPDEQMSDTYYFPTYNNTWQPLNSQLRFGVP